MPLIVGYNLTAQDNVINRHVGFFSPEGGERELLQYSLRVSRVFGNSSVTVVSCLWNFTIYGWDKQ